jgi:hypothetical protein
MDACLAVRFFYYVFLSLQLCHGLHHVAETAEALARRCNRR